MGRECYISVSLKHMKLGSFSVLRVQSLTCAYSQVNRPSLLWLLPQLHTSVLITHKVQLYGKHVVGWSLET